MIRSKVWLSLLLATTVAVTGCDNDGETDAGPALDAGGEEDAGPGEDGGSPPDPDAGMNQAPVGAITAPVAGTTIAEGETITFASTCMDPEQGVLTHAWDFGGGAAASTDAQPGAVQFDAAGMYTVTYTCTDDQGQDSTPDTVMVAVNAGTMASIDSPASDVTIAVGETVDFAGSCNDPEMSATITHFWDFMGGATNVTVEDPGPVQFDTAGTYVVTYTCFDNEGGRGSAMITVTVNTPPVGTIDMPMGDVAIPAGGTVDFQASCTDADGDTMLTHAWDFDGAAPAATVEDPGTITFMTDGIFTVTYTCTDSLMFDDEAPPTVQVIVGTPPTRFAVFSGDTLVDNVTQVVFTDITGATPGAPIDPIAGGWPAFADMPSTLAIQMSPDRRYIAFLADATQDNTDDLYLVDLLAPTPVAVNMTNLMSARDVEAFKWSPDSLKIAFNADRDTSGADEMFILDISTGLASATTTRAHAPIVASGDARPTSYQRPESNDDFAWSADSTKLYFLADLVTNDVIEAYVFDLTNVAAGAQVLHAAPVSGGDVLSLFAAGNDRAVILGDILVDNATDVFVVDTSGAGPYTAVRVTSVPATSTTEAFVSTTVNRVSPDGTRFVFYGDVELAGANELFGVDLTVAPTMGMAVRLNPMFTADTQDVSRTAWSPTAGDNRLLYRADEAINIAEELFLVDYTTATPSAAVRVNTALTVSTQDIDNFTWAPDGSGVAFVGDLVTDGIEELFYVPLPVAGVPGAQVQLNQMLPASADCDDDVLWVTPTQLVFEVDAALDGQEELFVVDTAMPTVATRLNSPITGTSTTTDYDILACALTADSRYVICRADPNESSTTEAFLLDPTAPGTSTLLHPSLVGTFQDASFILDEL